MIFYNKNFLGSSKKIAVFFVSVFYFLSASNVQAQLVVSDPLVLVQTTITAGASTAGSVASAAQGVTAAAEFTWSMLSKNLLDYIAYAAAQNLLTQLTNSTLKWIQGGFHGSPSFEVDTDQMLTEIADNIAGNLVLQLRGIASCDFTSTYRDDLANSVYLAPRKRDYTFDNKATCPFRQNWNFTATEFYGGLNKMTWDAYGAMLEDGGNPYGVQTITAKELAKKTSDAQAKRKQETSWSNGFTDIKDLNDCTYPESIFVTKDSLGKDPAYVQMLPEEREAKAIEINTAMISDPDFTRKNKQYCKTTTPGKIVEGQLTKTLGVDMDRIGFADNMNKIISAFLDQVMQKTLRGVFGNGNKSYSTGSIGDPLGGRAVGGPDACFVQVSTGGASPTTDGAKINGSVTCADPVANANVDVWFRWSEEPFSGDSRAANKDFPFPYLRHNAPTGASEPFYLILSGLTPGKTYYYSANAATSNPINNLSQIHGATMSFTVPSTSL